MSVCINSQESYNFIGSLLYTILQGNNYNRESTKYLYYRLPLFYKSNSDYLFNLFRDDEKLRDFIRTNTKALYYYNINSYLQRYEVIGSEKADIMATYKSYTPSIVTMNLTRRNILQGLQYLSSFYYQNELEDWDATFYLLCYYCFSILVNDEDIEACEPSLDW